MAKRVTVYFATNRQPMLDGTTDKIINFSSELGPTGGLDVRYGSAEVDVDLAAGTSEVADGSIDVADQQLVFTEGGAARLGSNTIFAALHADMAEKKRPTLAFIHGFSNTFKESIARAGWNLVFLGLEANIFAFSWPSIGTPTGLPNLFSDYTHDRETAAASGPAIARTIRRLHDYDDKLAREQHCDQSIHLLCHSMGNYALRNALQALMRLPDPGAGHGAARLSAGAPDPSVLRRTFDNIVLAAADEDTDAFDDPGKLKYLPRIGRSVTVYYSRADFVLGTLSAGTKFNGPRLGSDGPDNMDSISDRVTAVDATAIADPAKDPEGHQYYRTIKAARDDIAAVLEGTPQNAIPNREPIGPHRFAIKASKPRSQPKQRRRRVAERGRV
ncbi:MAG TPA: alpha/beta fold hydrolase [Pseudolabrys sp.]|nr:alpha/beta fold hydrolase [Pseudolabrys sp.]